MNGYLIYDQKDIKRNQSFIQWMIDEGLKLGLSLSLKSHLDPFDHNIDFVINRSRFYRISDDFEAHHIPVFNTAKVTKIANDKLLTYNLFSDFMLDTRVYNKQNIYPCVVKKRNGHGGTDVYLLKDNQHQDFDESYIVQPVNEVVGKDLRVYIINNEIIAAVVRTNNKDFKANYSLGGSIALYTLSKSEEDIVNTILETLPLDYGGIDFLFDKNGQLILNEIEDAVGARMLCELTDINIVNLYLSHIKARLNSN